MAAMFVYNVSLHVNQVPPHIDQASLAVPAFLCFYMLLQHSMSICVVSDHIANDVLNSEFYSLEIIHPRKAPLYVFQVEFI
jgi:hypothetical protein